MADTKLDLRGKAPGERADTVREAFEALDAGQELGLVSDMDPHPIYYELRSEFDVDEEASEIQERADHLYAAWFVKR